MNERDKKPTPFSLRLSESERDYLEKISGDVPLGAYIRAKILDEPMPRKIYRKPKKALKDQKALAQVQAMLGASRISSNLNQLAKAMNSGSLPVNKETREAIIQACKDIEFMRKELVRALGLRPPK